MSEEVDKRLYPTVEKKEDLDAAFIYSQGRSSITKKLRKMPVDVQYFDEKTGEIMTRSEERYIALDERLPEPEMHLTDFSTAVYRKIDPENTDVYCVRLILWLNSYTQTIMHDIGTNSRGEPRVDLTEDMNFLINQALIFANTSKGIEGKLLNSMREHRVIETGHHVIQGEEEKQKASLAEKIFGKKPKREEE